ncbi:MAG: serine hydrolase domain-containing protein [FCB group bacterium]|jgi:CubicO group peptidase (beta-lactamase class C family)|nr:serine hydrolase domain-containing protein [FCB group bacterium]
MDANGDDAGHEYHLASISKVFTALVIESLAREGIMDLDSPASLYLPRLLGASLPGSPVPTIRHLLEHTSGLAVVDGRFLARTPPGLRYLYWNAGYDLLADAAEQATGTPFDDLVKTRVLSPRGLGGVRFCSRDLSGLGRGSGGLCATRSDMERLAADLLGRWSDEPSSADLLCFTPGFDEHGHLLWLRQAGSAPGAGGELVFFPQQRTAVVILTDERYLPPLFDEVWRTLFRRLGLPRTDFNPARPPLLAPRDLAGTYRQPGTGDLLVFAPGSQGSLTVRTDSGAPISLARIDETRFAPRRPQEDRALLDALARAHAVDVIEFLPDGTQPAGCLYGGRYFERFAP